MKSILTIPYLQRKAVAPLVGAWIEIATIVYALLSLYVAPLVGAWIEIMIQEMENEGARVAPLVGAWIEISKILYLFLSKWSLPSWERGLKYF